MVASPARPPVHSRLARCRATLVLVATLAGPAALAGGVVSACYGKGRNAAPPQEETTVRVRNQSFLDHNVYVLNGGARSRLGTVTGNSTAVLRIPPSFVQPGVLLRFIADPIGSRATPVSDQIAVVPGDEVTLIIPPR